MTKYLINRILRSLLSVIIVVAIVMVMIYTWLNRDLIFSADPQFSHMKSNAKETYMMQQWERYGYVDYIPYADWLRDLQKSGEIDQETYATAVKFGNTAEKDNEVAAQYVQRFQEEMEAKGYQYKRLPAQTMTQSQGSFDYSSVTYPSGVVEESADNVHSATYVAGSFENGTPVIKNCFVDDYTNVTVYKQGLSKMGYSFTLGIISVALSYLLAIPLGITMALRKDKLVDKLGTFYIVFITAVPSLAYIFLFKSLGGKVGLPTTFDMEHPTWLMYVLPIISLALPSIANLMKWLRRYMIDQMNADYVKFARSGGLSEGEIFSKHILKNAIIPIVHGIPGSILGALTGAIITERVYVVPGVGDMLTRAISAYDNGVIVGMVLFYALLTVTSIILGDVLMSLLDPRISFTAKAR